jgi:hypothetical protein
VLKLEFNQLKILPNSIKELSREELKERGLKIHYVE